MRGNAGAGSGDYIEVERVEAKPARRITLAPAQKNLRLHGPGEALKRTFHRRPLVAGDVISTSVHAPRAYDGLPEEPRQVLNVPAYGLQEIRLVVVATDPRGVVQMTPETEVTLRPSYEEPAETRRPDITYDDIGGLGDTVEQIREMVELPLRHPELLQRLGIDPKGVLLHGPPGTGKTLLARVVASEAEAAFFLINGPEILGRMQGESEERLRQVFAQARGQPPAIVFIDEIDSIAPKRVQVGGEAERRLVAQLLTLMDGLEPRQNVMVVGATNRVDAIDEALRRPGRFDREIIIGVPDQDGRYEILCIHTRGMPLNPGRAAREAAGDARRFRSGAEARPALGDARDHDPGAERDLEGHRRPRRGARAAAGVDRAAAEEARGLPPAGHPAGEGVFLLYGPPGTGKTLLAKAVAREAEANFVATKSSDLLSKWYGESEQQVARLFRRARQVAPTVIFIDEIDSLVPARGGGLGEPAVTERVVNTILSEMDGLEELQGVVVIGATNRPNLVDPALLHPGRFDELIYVPVLDRESRRHILGIQTGKMPLGADVDLDELAERYTGADLSDVVRRAGLVALRRGRETVGRDEFEAALAESRASVTPEMESEYAQIQASLGKEGPLRQPIGFRPPSGG